MHNYIIKAECVKSQSVMQISKQLDKLTFPYQLHRTVCVCVCVCGQWSALRLPGSFNLHANEGNKQRGAAAGGGTVTTQEI